MMMHFALGSLWMAGGEEKASTFIAEQLWKWLDRLPFVCRSGAKPRSHCANGSHAVLQVSAESETH
jgi:hypothetical protein